MHQTMDHNFIPALLLQDQKLYSQYLLKLDSLVSRIHIDFADSTLTPHTTLLPKELVIISVKAGLDAHLMVSEPKQYLPALADLGYSSIIIHTEIDEPIDDVITLGRSYRFTIGLALNPETELPALLPYVDTVDFVQLMGVQPGLGNQPLLPQTFDRLKQLRSFVSLPIAIDGGVRFSNADDLLTMGATMVVVGLGGVEINGNLIQGIKEWQNLIAKMYRR